MSGAIIKKGHNILQANKCSVMQSHTYTGSSTRAMMTATAVLKEMPKWFEIISKNGEEMTHIFSYLAKVSGGMITAQGQGIMWGCMLTQDGQNQDEQYRLKAFATFKKCYEEVEVLPYFVPVGGCMVAPMVDIDVGTVYEIGLKLEEVIQRTIKEIGWEPQFPESDSALEIANSVAMNANSAGKCSSNLHASRTCTSCSSFVSENILLCFRRCFC